MQDAGCLLRRRFLIAQQILLSFKVDGNARAKKRLSTRSNPQSSGVELSVGTKIDIAPPANRLTS